MIVGFDWWRSPFDQDRKIGMLYGHGVCKRAYKHMPTLVRKIDPEHFAGSLVRLRWWCGDFNEVGKSADRLPICPFSPTSHDAVK
jgi:hypothetical protein